MRVNGYAIGSLAEAVPFAETIAGPSSAALANVCRETGVYAAAGLYRMPAGKFLQLCHAWQGPTVLLAATAKFISISGIDRFLSAGDRPFEVFELPFGKVGNEYMLRHKLSRVVARPQAYGRRVDRTPHKLAAGRAGVRRVRRQYSRARKSFFLCSL
jgi:hypothetical protein